VFLEHKLGRREIQSLGTWKTLGKGLGVRVSKKQRISGAEGVAVRILNKEDSGGVMEQLSGRETEASGDRRDEGA